MPARHQTIPLLSVLLVICPVFSQAQTASPDDAPPRREIALTFDDLPIAAAPGDLATARDVTRRLLAALAGHRAPSIGFVNEKRVLVWGEADARIEILRQWLDAGHLLGNHTFSHVSFHDTPLDRYTEDVIRGEVVTRRLMEERGHRTLFFRHPYTRTGPTREAKEGLEAFLRAHNYRVAPFTIEDADFIFNAVYVRAIQSGETAEAERIRQAYLDHLDAACAFFERRSRELLGYEVKQILLIHANVINSQCLDALLTQLERRGYSFVTLEQALQDPAYEIKDDYLGPMGLSWIHRWAISRGQDPRLRDEPDPPRPILERYRQVTAPPRP